MRGTAKPLLPRLFLIAGLAGALALALLAWLGQDYYLLPAAERPYHPHHAGLRPSGTLGLSLAILGTAFMFLNLTYLVRKRAAFLRRLGSLRGWMAFHVFTGLLGAGMIVIHSAFLPRSELGILASATLAVIVITGIIGRYIYARVPRSLEGHELEYEEIRRVLAGHLAELERLGLILPPAAEGAVPSPLDRPSGFLSSVASLIAGGIRSRREHRELRRAVLSSKLLAPRAHRILPLLGRLARERMWLARHRELRSLMASWRFLHRWLALLMLAVILCHIAVAFKFGDLWILRGGR